MKYYTSEKLRKLSFVLRAFELKFELYFYMTIKRFSGKMSFQLKLYINYILIRKI